MDALRYLLFSILICLGPVIGFVISLYTKQEIKQGGIYLRFIQKLIILILAILIVVWKLNTFAALVTIVALVFFYFLNSILIFFGLSVVLFASSFFPEKMAITNILVFLFGVLFGLVNSGARLRRIFGASIVFLVSSLLVFGLWVWLA